VAPTGSCASRCSFYFRDKENRPNEIRICRYRIAFAFRYVIRWGCLGVLGVEVLPTGFAKRLVVLGIIDSGRVSVEETSWTEPSTLTPSTTTVARAAPIRYPPPELRYVYLKWLGDQFDPDTFDPQKINVALRGFRNLARPESVQNAFLCFGTDRSLMLIP
jgi:hypothetical protein